VCRAFFIDVRQATFSSDLPADNSLLIASACLNANQTYLIRVWSAGDDTTSVQPEIFFLQKTGEACIRDTLKLST
jgi:hypothetical protein